MSAHIAKILTRFPLSFGVSLVVVVRKKVL
jgi:hypothetical protein